jgi:protein gp37
MTVQLAVLNSQVMTVEDQLAESEAIMERGLSSFLEVGRELMKIRAHELYKTSGYRSFSDYLMARWPDLGRAYADRVIAATRVVDNLAPIGGTLPVSESQVRPLTVLEAPEQLEAWQRVLEKTGKKPVTAKLVEQTVEELKAEIAARIEPEEDEAEEETPDLDHPPIYHDDEEDDEEDEEGVPEPDAPDAEPEPEETPLLVLQVVAEQAPTIRPYYDLPAWEALSADEQQWVIAHAADKSGAGFNRTNDNVEWALWTWNPVTGCNHGCDYCYARDIANRFYEDLPEGERFAPVFRPNRLHAPRRMKVPAAAARNVGEKNVFTGSMTDLFGKWVPQDWIDAVFHEVVRAEEWNFLFLTKFPQRLAEQQWPENAWVGTTVDRQARVATAERAFRGVTAGIKWLSVEPMLERLTFSSLEMFDWVVIGGASESSQTPASQPPTEWVEHLVRQARAAGCQVYFKTNLGYRPREYPQGVTR